MITYSLAPWQTAFLIAGIVVAVLDVAGIVWIVLRLLDEKKRLEKYKHKGTV